MNSSLYKKEDLGCFILRHNDNVKQKWDIIIIICAIYNCFSIPFETAFQAETMRTEFF